MLASVAGVTIVEIEMRPFLALPIAAAAVLLTRAQVTRDASPPEGDASAAAGDSGDGGDAGAASAPDAADAAGAAPAVPACIAVTSVARLVAYGYDHVVTLTNGCSRDASCEVSTDVNPAALRADVAQGSSVEVVTFKSSPSSTFTARVRCALR